MAPRPRPSRARALAAVLAAAVVALLVAPAAGPEASSAVAAGGAGTLLLEDTFRGTEVEDPTYRVGGARDGSTTPWTPCLTAGASPTTAPVPGCALTTPDAPGTGALRLTPKENGVNGFLLYDHPLPLRAGLDITFTSYQWGGNGADGISFFLADGARSLTRAGGYGGALGYSNRGNVDGVAGGLLGVGLDAYGNYPLETRNEDCRTSGGWIPPSGASSSTYRYHVSVRGDGEGKRGYCLLGAPGRARALERGGSVRPEPVVTRVVVDPPATATPMVTVYLDGSEVTKVPQPAVLARTSTFRFGWGSSTGGQTDNHEIGMISVSSVDPLGPDLALTAASSAEATTSGSPAPLALTARVSAVGGPLPAGEPVALSADAPEGATFDPPAGTGWDCSGTTPARVRCAWTADRATRPGTTLPVLTVPLRSARSGRQQVSASVTSASDEPAVREDNAVTAAAVFTPGVEPVDGGEVDASAEPRPVVVALRTDAQPEVTTRVTDGGSPAGTVEAGRGTEVVLRPAPGRSGRLRGTVAVTDRDGVTSPGSSVGLAVRPVAPAVAGTTRSGERVVLPAPSPPVGTGPFRYELLGTGDPSVVEHAEVDPVDGAVTVVPAAGTSGRLVLSYRVVGADDVASAPTPVTVDVRPTAGGEVVRLPLDAAGRAAVEVVLPEPTGTGPFTFRLLEVPPRLVAAELSGDGTLTVTTTSGRSGTTSLRYVVEDADGTSSDPVTVPVRVAPHVLPAGGTGTASSPAVVAGAPVVVGTGPFRFRGQQPGGGATATVDGGTGVVTLDPRGTAGRYAVAVTAEDADGVTSDPAVVELVVAPDARDALARSEVSSGETPVRLRPVVLGAEDAELAVTRQPDPADGRAEVDGEDLVVTPAPGFSGRLVVGYTATGAGVTSAPAEAVLEVLPGVAGAAATAVSGGRAEVPLPEGVGRGPFTYRLLDDPAPAATARVQGGDVLLEPARTTSGVLRLRYAAVDRDGLTSAPAELAVTVAPAAAGLTATGAAAQEPVDLVGPLPDPAGTGPFTFALVEAPDPAAGSASTDPVTGVTTLRPAPGRSGVALAGYRVVDAQGLPSAPAPVAFVVLPTVGGLPEVATAAGEAVVLAPPAPVGTGPFRWDLAVVPAADEASVVVDPLTGRLDVRPARGFSGPMVVAWTVTDASGLVSRPAQAVVRVAAAVPPAEPPTAPSPTAPSPAAPTVPAPTVPAPGGDVPAGPPTRTTPSSTTAPAATASSPRAASPTVGTGSGVRPAGTTAPPGAPGRLARTGADAVLPTVVGGLLVVAGAGLHVLSRRRRRP